MPLPELIAHRGHAACYPENSLPGIEAAVGAGARFVEVDVQLSADRVPVLFHDRSLERVCGVPGAVHEHDFATLSALSASERERFGERFAGNRLASLAQFAELLAGHPDVNAFVEIKTGAVDRFGTRAVLDTVARVLAPVARRCVLISFSVPLLADARRGFPSRGGQAGWGALGGVIDRWDERRRMMGLRLDYLFCDLKGLPPSGPLEFESARLAVYEVADAQLALALAGRGVQFIETFDIARLAAELAQRDGP
jgi:glycerophosphoryl diester phosphodiesterase